MSAMAIRGGVTGLGFPGRALTTDEVRQVVSVAADQLRLTSKRVLILIPDGTRTMPMPLMFELLQQELAPLTAACDYLVALGTHPLMSDSQLSALLGQPVANGLCGAARIFNHRWDTPSTFVELGTIASESVARASGGLMNEPVRVRINRLALDYDQVLICGPVFPHEVVGFSGGNKYLFPGIGGPEIIGQTHWLGALLGSRDLIGTPFTPVREMINLAAAMVPTPVACLALVVKPEGTHGIYFGPAKDAWQSAAELSAHVHIHWIDRPFQRVLSVMPSLYDDLWTAAKGMYKVEPAVADGGEVILYAPHITEVSYTHGAEIDRIGYHCRDYFLKQWDRFKSSPRSVLAHSTHLRGQGTYDEPSGIESPRIHVTLATGIPEERCRRLNLGYLDPATVDVEQWKGREDSANTVIPRAGETLYRLKPGTAS